MGISRHQKVGQATPLIRYRSYWDLTAVTMAEAGFKGSPQSRPSNSFYSMAGIQVPFGLATR